MINSPSPQFTNWPQLRTTNVQFLGGTSETYKIDDLTWSKIMKELCKQTGSTGRASSCEWKWRWGSTIPCLPSATSPEAVFVPAGELACKAPGTQICWAAPGPTRYQSTVAEGRSGQAELGHSGSDGWCLVCGGYPEGRKGSWMQEQIYRTKYNVIT